jgi:spore coat polysaccharide biosynthesis protein SpsF
MALAILQARMSSSRLPGKVMRPLLGQPMIARQIERLGRAKGLSGLLVATSTDPSDQVIVDWCEAAGVACFRGPLEDVRARFFGALEAAGGPETFVRLTADCPLTDPDLIDRCLESHAAGDFDYTYTSKGWTFPKGLDVEIVRTAALERAARSSEDAYEREHVTPFIYRHPDLFRLNALTCEPPARWRWTVDTPEDFAFVSAAYGALYPAKPDFTSDDILAWQATRPDLALPNVVS